MKAKSNTNLEEYLDFFVNPEQISLSIKQLNQVVHMQGFKKIHKTTKKTMCDALSTVDLTVPFRSTLSDGASPSSVAVTVQEVASDLAELKWSECAVRSVLELRSPSKENLNLNMNMNTSRNDQPPNSFSGKRATGKRSKIPKKRKVSSILEIESDPSTTHHHHHHHHPCFSC